MGIANAPVVAGGGIKSVQRGSAGGAGDVTITSVDITKSFVTVYGTASSGTVAVTGDFNTTTSNMNFFGVGSLACSQNLRGGLDLAISGGTNNLVAAVVQGFLANATTLTVSGACRFEVVEFA